MYKRQRNLLPLGDLEFNIPDGWIYPSAGVPLASVQEESCTIKIRVQPRASADQVVGFEEGTLRLRVTAPPTGGKANAGVTALIAKSLGVAKSKVQIVRGHSSRDKVVSVAALDEAEVRRRLGANTGG